MNLIQIVALGVVMPLALGERGVVVREEVKLPPAVEARFRNCTSAESKPRLCFPDPSGEESSCQKKLIEKVASSEWMGRYLSIPMAEKIVFSGDLKPQVVVNLLVPEFYNETVMESYPDTGHALFLPLKGYCASNDANPNLKDLERDFKTLDEIWSQRVIKKAIWRSGNPNSILAFADLSENCPPEVLGKTHTRIYTERMEAKDPAVQASSPSRETTEKTENYPEIAGQYASYMLGNEAYARGMGGSVDTTGVSFEDQNGARLAVRVGDEMYQSYYQDQAKFYEKHGQNTHSAVTQLVGYRSNVAMRYAAEHPEVLSRKMVYLDKSGKPVLFDIPSFCTRIDFYNLSCNWEKWDKFQKEKLPRELYTTGFGVMSAQ